MICDHVIELELPVKQFQRARIAYYYNVSTKIIVRPVGKVAQNSSANCTVLDSGISTEAPL